MAWYKLDEDGEVEGLWSGGGDPVDVGIIGELLPISSYRTMRARLSGNHFAEGSEQSFTGFTDDELSAFTIVKAADADTMMSEITSVSSGEKIIIELDWDGISTTGNRAFGANASTLTANASVDFGYDRPVLDVYVRPAAGRTPQIQGTFSGNELYMIGVNKIEFNGVGIVNCKLRLDWTATFPLITILAVNNSMFESSPNDALLAKGSRLIHVENTEFKSCNGGVKSSANYTRVFNCSFSDHGQDDMVGLRGYNELYQNNWTAHAWVAGCIDYDHSDRNPTSGLHPDFFQISSPADAHKGYSSLIECNIAHINRPGASSGSQGIFGDDGTGFNGEWLVHNNIIGISAYWALIPFDPNDSQEKKVYGNMFFRTAELSTNQDTNPRIRGLSDGVSGGGSLDVVKNYCSEFLTGLVDGENFSENLILDPRASAVAGTTYQDVLTGNGTFTTDGSGFLIYTSPDAGMANAADAKLALSNFLKPINGWAVDAGAIDPSEWPSNWASLQ